MWSALSNSSDLFSSCGSAIVVQSTLRGNFFKFSKMQVSALFKVFGVNFSLFAGVAGLLFSSLQWS